MTTPTSKTLSGDVKNDLENQWKWADMKLDQKEEKLETSLQDSHVPITFQRWQQLVKETKTTFAEGEELQKNIIFLSASFNRQLDSQRWVDYLLFGFDDLDSLFKRTKKQEKVLTTRRTALINESIVRQPHLCSHRFGAFPFDKEELNIVCNQQYNFACTRCFLPFCFIHGIPDTEQTDTSVSNIVNFDEITSIRTYMLEIYLMLPLEEQRRATFMCFSCFAKPAIEAYNKLQFKKTFKQKLTQADKTNMIKLPQFISELKLLSFQYLMDVFWKKYASLSIEQKNKWAETFDTPSNLKSLKRDEMLLTIDKWAWVHEFTRYEFSPVFYNKGDKFPDVESVNKCQIMNWIDNQPGIGKFITGKRITQMLERFDKKTRKLLKSNIYNHVKPI